MSDVKRYPAKMFTPETPCAHAADFDTVLARKALLETAYVAAGEREHLLRKELQLIKNEDLKHKCLLEQESEIKALQQRLTVAEQRAAFLERVMRDTLNDEDGLFITAEFNTGPTWSALQKHGRSIEAALKPAAEGENHG